MDASDGGARVQLFVGPDCSLCQDAREMLRFEGIEFSEHSDPAYAERIPVITVNGQVVTEGRVSARPIKAALRRAW